MELMREHIPIRGRLALTVLEEDGRLAARREGANVVCTTGYTALAAALVWSGIQDQATNIGATTPTYLTPLYGAIGTGAGTPAKNDTALFAEIARQVVGAGAAGPATGSIAAQTSWLFYFPQPTTTLTVTEAGVFTGATAAVNSGAMLDHWAFSPAVTVTPSQSLILQVALALGP